jgi:hypothetical protein
MVSLHGSFGWVVSADGARVDWITFARSRSTLVFNDEVELVVLPARAGDLVLNLNGPPCIVETDGRQAPACGQRGVSLSFL